ncbi:hypothetical protein LNP18_06155 [Leuconostoc citreum]|uniref:hypothetical protein n=1 Tax=Leuconostoc citreum TaxID=33964 RepID=UPI00200ADED1|nr:hypothetical protein [Leuconostoc citreum]MCK8605685.1 hypothetical protein [Leuconostoc citreum]
MMETFQYNMPLNKKGTQSVPMTGYTVKTKSNKHITARIIPAFGTVNGKGHWQIAVRFTEGTARETRLFSKMNSYQVLDSGLGRLTALKMRPLNDYEEQVLSLIHDFIERGIDAWDNPMTTTENYQLLA